MVQLDCVDFAFSCGYKTSRTISLGRIEWGLGSSNSKIDACMTPHLQNASSHSLVSKKTGQMAQVVSRLRFVDDHLKKII